MKDFADFGIDLGGRTGEVDTICPQCSHERKNKRAKCLSVNTDKGLWQCHHCGWAGSLEKGVEKTELHWQKPKYRPPEVKPATNLPRKVVEWFANRGIPESALARNQVGFGEIYMPQVEDRVKAIAFPYLDGDKHINTKWRDAEKNFRMEAGAQRVLYGLNDIQADRPLIWVEGEIDKLTLEVAGYPCCVSVPDGAPAPDAKSYESKFDFLDAAADRLAAVKTHILAVDSDAPGQRLEEELARRLGREKCLRVTWPKGTKDANEVLLQLGVEMVKMAIQNAQPYPIKGIFEVLDLSERVELLHQNGRERAKSTGWKALDGIYSVREGEFTTITGIPNSGKSEWLDALLLNLAKREGWAFGIYSPENQPLELHIQKFVEKMAGLPFQSVTPRELKAITHWLNDHFFFILPDEPSLDAILDRAKTLVFRKGIKGLVIDPWNEVEHDRPANQTETEYISQKLSVIRRFGRTHGVHMFVVAHPTKLKKLASGDYEIPTPYDISGSAHWRNKSDNCVTVWRPFEPGNRLVEVHIQKVRFKDVGKAGEAAELVYEYACGRYHDVGNAPQEVEYSMQEPAL